MWDTLCALLTNSMVSGHNIGSYHYLSTVLREIRPFFRLSKWLCSISPGKYCMRWLKVVFLVQRTRPKNQIQQWILRNIENWGGKAKLYQETAFTKLYVEKSGSNDKTAAAKWLCTQKLQFQMWIEGPSSPSINVLLHSQKQWYLLVGCFW